MNEELSLGSSDFDEIINEDRIYVDKTDIIEKIIRLNRKYYFLSRPRRFGKSLLVSTFKELFEGNEELFEGLYIYDKWDWSESFPVIHLDLSNPKAKSSEMFEKSLNFYMDSVAENKFGVELRAEFSNDKLRELIDKIHKNTGKEVVVLIDEYDKPIPDKRVSNSEISVKIRYDVLI